MLRSISAIELRRVTHGASDKVETGAGVTIRHLTTRRFTHMARFA